MVYILILCILLFTIPCGLLDNLPHMASVRTINLYPVMTYDLINKNISANLLENNIVRVLARYNGCQTWQWWSDYIT